ncbi:MAG: DUF1365 family protein [Candidatus Accumulibacter sp.]|nr:DUF1365 family protein [Candidatus Accumulibacter propinquus]
MESISASASRIHGARDGSPPAWIRKLLQKGIRADGEVWLQCFPRVLGFVFNPINMWFLPRPEGRSVGRHPGRSEPAQPRRGGTAACWPAPMVDRSAMASRSERH